MTLRCAYRPAVLLLPTLLASYGLSGCGGGSSSSTASGSAPLAAVTPVITVIASPSGSTTTAQALSVTVSAASSSGVPAGSVLLSSGSYASFPVSLSSGQAVISVPAGLLALGTDTLTATYTPATSASYKYSYPFRALPLASGDVLVSV